VLLVISPWIRKRTVARQRSSMVRAVGTDW
jgi:hypothetical protein